MLQYLTFSFVAIKEGLAFRVNLFTSLFGGFFRLILLVSVWKAIYIGQERLAGYNKEEILFYVVLAAAIGAGGLLSVGTVLGNRNKTGDIAVDLVRPVSLPWCYFFSSVGRFCLQFCIKVVPTFLIGFFLIPRIPPIRWQQLLSFLLLFMGGSFLHFWLNLACESFTFRTKSSYGINVLWGPGVAFLTGLIVPISFYPKILEDFIHWTPFPSVAYTPIKILMGKVTISSGLAAIYQSFFHLSLETAFIMEQFSWIAIVLPLALWVYKWNERSVEIQGG